MSNDNLKKLVEFCKCGVHITINEHRNYYKTVKEALEDLDCLECSPEISEKLKTEIIKHDNIVDIHFYPETPIGFYHIVHYNLDKAVEAALECIK